MIGPRVGIKGGPRVGIAAGPSADEIAAGSTTAWTVDAASGKATPSSSTEWTAFIAANALSVAVPDSLWLLQEASGNPSDSIGAFPLTAAGAVTYRQALSGWTRVGVGLTDGVNSQFGTTSASLPTGGTASQTVLIIGNIPAAPAANRNIYEGQTGSTIRINSTPRVVAISGANVATGTVSPAGTTRPYVYRENFTAATSTVMTDQEKLVPVHGTISGRNLRIGSSATSVAGVVGYACAWYNANAEISDANMKSLLQAMGFAIPW